MWREGLHDYLSARLVGQAEAVAEFAGAITRAEAGPFRPHRPKSFLLLLGPTGTGKTEMVKLTARHLYGDDAEDRFARFDLGEFQHRDSVVRLLGGPAQPALLGKAIDKINTSGGGILLLDEVEKAHPDLLTLLLSFDDARTTMADGITRDLSLCHILLTSNLGAAEASQMRHNGYNAICRKVRLEAERVLRKETVARFGAVIVMNALGFEAQRSITRRILDAELKLHSHHRNQRIECTDEAVVTFLTARGHTNDLGARPLRGAVERWVGDALLFWDLQHRPQASDTLELYAEKERLALRAKATPPLSELIRPQNYSAPTQNP